MKLELSNVQVDDQENQYVLSIYVDQPSDYALLNKLIKVGDTIETKIRRKDKYLKNPIFYAIVDLLVEQIEYVTDPSETIHIVGKITNSDNDNIKEGTKQSLWITDGCELKLKKDSLDTQDLKIVDDILHPKPLNAQTKSIASSRDLQVKCFEVLHKYMAKKFSLVTYGNETFDALENGAIKVLFVTEEFIEQQNEEWKNILSSESHKYHGANIVVYDQGAKNWEELSNFGGIIGVLKYDFISQNASN